METASAWAFAAAYLASSCAISAVSCLTSSTGVENQRSMERFINPYANQNMTITGKKESSKLPTTKRVRNFDPNTPIRRSAKSLIRFRARTNVSVTNSKNTNAESAARKTVCCVVLGLIKGRSNDDSESRIANSTKLPAARKMISRLRSLGPRGLPEAIGQCFCQGAAAAKNHYSLG